MAMVMDLMCVVNTVLHLTIIIVVIQFLYTKYNKFKYRLSYSI